MDVRGQVPFLRLLIPLIVGILFSRFISSYVGLSIIGILGVTLIFFSFFKSSKRSYSRRWFFGLGLMLFIFFFSTQYFRHFKEFSSYTFPQEKCSYIGEVMEIPQKKKRSIACEVKLIYPVNKKALLYFESDENSTSLKPGDQIIVSAFIKPFKNLGNPNEFDYNEFMTRKGFSGTAYINSSGWVDTGKRNRTIKNEALLLRAEILDRFKTFELSTDEFAFLSAITLGHKDDLSNELKNAFRASGTSHILAVSGLHVGVIYFIIISLFPFLGNRGRSFCLKQILVLLTLWTYVFITGMPVSVIRAAIMLTLFSIGSLFHKKGYHYNTLSIAAFFILIINPYYLFDVGFQLSFAAVFSILFFQPKIVKLYTPKFKISTYLWNLMTVSLAAQIGVFPLGLYYFGTFPTYFFVANLLVIPLVGVIIYASVALSFFSLFATLNISILNTVYNLIRFALQFTIKSVLQIIYFFESLPLATINESHISFLQILLLFVGLFSLTFYILRNRANMLIIFLSSIALILTTNTYSHIVKPSNQFVVYNSYDQRDMGYLIAGKKIALEGWSNRIVEHPSSTVVLLTENIYNSKMSDSALSIDYLILSSDNSFSMDELELFYKPKTVIVDASISNYTVQKLKRDCENLQVSFHDISELGAYSINF